MENSDKEGVVVGKKDLKLNITSIILPILSIFLSVAMLFGGGSNSGSTGAGAPGLIAVIIGLVGISFLLGLLLSIVAIIRKEPRKKLSIASLILNGCAAFLLIKGFFEMVEF